MKIKQLTSIICLLSISLTPVYAASTDITTAGGSGDSKVILEVEGSAEIPPVEDVFSATVPIELPIHMDSSGNITVPTEAKIINNVANKDIQVISIEYKKGANWEVGDFDSDISSLAKDTKTIGVRFRGSKVDTNGIADMSADNWVIPKSSNIALDMDVKLPLQSASQKQDIASVQFKLDWATEEPTNPNIKHTVTIVQGINGTVVGDSLEVSNGGTIVFPAVTPDAGYILDKWINTVSGSEITTATRITEDISIKPIFKPSAVQSFTVTFQSEANGTVEGILSTSVESGKTVIFPNPVPNMGYQFDKWSILGSGAEITTTEPITSDITIVANFREKDSSPKEWFTSSAAGTISGYSGVYTALTDKPTEVILPYFINGEAVHTVTGLGNQPELVSLVLPESVTTIGMWGINNSPKLNLVIPDSVTKIDRFGISGLASVTFGKSIERDDLRFVDESAINKLIIKDGVTRIGNNAFYKIKGLTSVSLPNSITEIGESAFAECADLEVVNLPNSLKTIGRSAFSTSQKLTTMTLPDSITTIGDFAFAANILWNPGQLSNKLESIGTRAFFSTGVVDVTIPDSVISMGDYAFGTCRELTNVTVGSGLKAIPNNAFDSGFKLKTVAIPKTVETIGTNAFRACSMLTSITIDNTNGGITGSPWGAPSGDSIVNWLK